MLDDKNMLWPIHQKGIQLRHCVAGVNRTWLFRRETKTTECSINIRFLQDVSGIFLNSNHRLSINVQGQLSLVRYLIQGNCRPDEKCWPKNQNRQPGSCYLILLFSIPTRTSSFNLAPSLSICLLDNFISHQQHHLNKWMIMDSCPSDSTAAILWRENNPWRLDLTCHTSVLTPATFPEKKPDAWR